MVGKMPHIAKTHESKTLRTLLPPSYGTASNFDPCRGCSRPSLFHRKQTSLTLHWCGRTQTARMYIYKRREVLLSAFSKWIPKDYRTIQKRNETKLKRCSRMVWMPVRKPRKLTAVPSGAQKLTLDSRCATFKMIAPSRYAIVKALLLSTPKMNPLPFASFAGDLC